MGCLTLAQRPLRMVVNQYINHHLKKGNTMEAQWCKLKSGNWGVRIRFEGQEGSEIIVTTKDGKESSAVLKARVAKFDDAELWEVEK